MFTNKILICVNFQEKQIELNFVHVNMFTIIILTDVNFQVCTACSLQAGECMDVKNGAGEIIRGNFHTMRAYHTIQTHTKM